MPSHKEYVTNMLQESGLKGDVIDQGSYAFSHVKGYYGERIILAIRTPVSMFRDHATCTRCIGEGLVVANMAKYQTMSVSMAVPQIGFRSLEPYTARLPYLAEMINKLMIGETPSIDENIRKEVLEIARLRVFPTLSFLDGMREKLGGWCAELCLCARHGRIQTNNLDLIYSVMDVSPTSILRSSGYYNYVSAGEELERVISIRGNIYHVFDVNGSQFVPSDVNIHLLGMKTRKSVGFASVPGVSNHPNINTPGTCIPGSICIRTMEEIDSLIGLGETEAAIILLGESLRRANSSDPWGSWLIRNGLKRCYECGKPIRIENIICCDRCGEFLCEDCKHAFEGGVFCEECYRYALRERYRYALRWGRDYT